MIRNIWLAGPPNSGKTSLFNLLTGLRQKTGNYPGITVDKSQATIVHPVDKKSIQISDLPGTYSLVPNSSEEEVIWQLILEQPNPDLCLVVLEAHQPKKGLYLLSQLVDLGIPCLGVINMVDTLKEDLDLDYLQRQFGVPFVGVSVRKRIGIEPLKSFLFGEKKVDTTPTLVHSNYPEFLEVNLKQRQSEDISQKAEADRNLSKDSILRHQLLRKRLKDLKIIPKRRHLDPKLDQWFLHPVFGYLIFFTVLAFIFQAIFSWSAPLMDSIDAGFGWLTEMAKINLPESLFTNFLTDGILAGLGGVVIFVPQIAILFILLSLLEEVGYMARAVVLFDQPMRKIGLHGKSVVPLLSGFACSIPAVLGARTIENYKERLLTIFVVPFMTCSARLPVYAILISLAVPNESIGFFNQQGLVLLILYLLGIGFAMLTSLVGQLFLKVKQNHAFVMELPSYQMPIFRNISLYVWGKTKAFLFNAGKIILVLSVIVWFLGTHGSLENEQTMETTWFAQTELDDSYIATIGKGVEPLISPLGYDWKIGIALLTSIAAREVFVGTLATLYSIEDEADTTGMVARMKAEKHHLSGLPLYDRATAYSLLVFYALAMQCLSTLAVVKMETRSLRFTLIQFGYMSLLAYLVAWLTYLIF